MINNNAQARHGMLEWLHQFSNRAASQPEGDPDHKEPNLSLDWVGLEGEDEPELPPFSFQTRAQDKTDSSQKATQGKIDSSQKATQDKTDFYHVPYARFLPTLMETVFRGRSAGRKEARGNLDSPTAFSGSAPNLLEAMQLLLAWPEWWIEGRQWLLTPQTPMSVLLKELIDAFRLDVPAEWLEDTTVYPQLLQFLPHWWVHRGELRYAQELLKVLRPARNGEEMAIRETCPEGSRPLFLIKPLEWHLRRPWSEQDAYEYKLTTDQDKAPKIEQQPISAELSASGVTTLTGWQHSEDLARLEELWIKVRPFVCSDPGGVSVLLRFLPVWTSIRPYVSHVDRGTTKTKTGPEPRWMAIPHQ